MIFAPSSPSPTVNAAPHSIIIPDVFALRIFYVFFFTETNVSPVKNKGLNLSTVVTTSDDSEEEMAVFKQPGKKRKINNSKDLVSGFS